MNLSDPSSLRSLSASIQWIVIIIALIAVCLQTAKHFVDLREKRLTSQITVAKEAKQHEREQRLQAELTLSQKRIRTLIVELKIDMEANWKNGNIPDPNRDLMLGATKEAWFDFGLKDGRRVHVNFNGHDDLKIYPINETLTRVSYFTSAEPGADIFTLLPDEVQSLDSFWADGWILPQQVEDLQLTLHAVSVVFYINGKASFEVNIQSPTKVDMTAPDFRGLGVTLLHAVTVRHLE
jgi:hypothetical protein